MLVVTVGAAWIGRTLWLGPLVARSLVQVLHEQVGGHWQVEAVEGTFLGGVRVRGLTCLEPAAQSIVARCRIESVTVTYSLWRFFGSAPLTAIDAVSIEDANLVIDSTIGISPPRSSPAQSAQLVLPWMADIHAHGSVEIITTAGKVHLSELNLSGPLADLHLACDTRLDAHDVGHLQLDAHHSGASLVAGWRLESRVSYAAEEPLLVAVMLEDTEPQVRTTVTAGKGTQITVRDSAQGWLFEGTADAAQMAPALRRLALAFKIPVPKRGQFSVAGIISDDAAVHLTTGQVTMPGVQLALTDARWQAAHGLTAMATLQAEVHPAEVYPVLAPWCGDAAVIEVQARVFDGQIDAQVKTQIEQWAVSAQATIASEMLSPQWRTAHLHVDVEAANPAQTNHARLFLSGTWEALGIGCEVQTARLDVGTWHGENIAANVHATLTNKAPEPLLDGDWSLNVGAISTKDMRASLPFASTGELHADAMGLRITTVTSAPVIAHGELLNATPYTTDMTWAQAIEKTPLHAYWKLRETDLSVLAPLLPPGVHLDGNVSGHGEVLDVLAALKWSAAMVLTKANLGGLPPLPPLLDIDAELSANADGVTVTSLRARVGGGPVEVSGNCPLPGKPGNFDISLTGRDALVFQRTDVRVRADADVHLTGTWVAPELKGQVHVTDLVATTPVSWFGGRDLPSAQSPFEGMNGLPPPWNRLQLDVQVTGGQDAKKSLEIRNNVLVASLAVNVHLSGKAELPIASGEISCRSGRLALPFSSYRIDRAALRFNPANPYDPAVEASASTQVQGYVLTVQVSGTLQHPHIEVTSSPPLAPDDALVLASTGRLPAEMRRDGTSASALGVALPFMGRELHRWVVGDGFADDDESLLDRFVVRFDEDRSDRGLATVRLEYQLAGPWHFAGERDRYEAYNLGLMWRWIFNDPARLNAVAAQSEETPESQLADWEVVAAPGVPNLPVSASTLLATVPARQRRGDEARQPAQWASAAQRMVDRLHEAGFPEANVLPDESGGVVRFVVHPGQPWTISTTQLLGAPDELASALESIVARGLAHGVAPTPARVSAVRSAVRSTLVYAGYALARVNIAVQREPLVAAQATATITIVPSLHYRFSLKPPLLDVAVPARLRQEITAACQAVNGQNWTRRVAVGLRAQLLELLRQHGYVFATVVLSGDEPALLPDVEGEVHILTGQPALLHAIILSGFHATSETYVRKRLHLEPGALLRGDEPNAALNRLRRSGVARSFSSTLKPAAPVVVGVTPIPESEAEVVPVDLEIVAEEAPPRSVELGAGYGSYEGVRGSALYRDTNLFGWGRTWELGGDVSQRSYGGHTRIIDRDLLGIQRTLSTRLSGGWRQEPSFDRTFYVSETSVRAPLTSAIDLRTAYTFEAERANDRAASADDSQDQGFVLNGVLNANLIWEGRDDRSLPTQGGMAELGFGISDPALGSQLSYVEWSSRLGWVQPVVDERLVLAAHVAGKVRRITDGAESLPIQYRLFLGGSTTVRSFGLNQLSPITADGQALGGLTAGYANFEVRTKITGNFHAAAFYDVGKVSERSWTLDGALGQAIGGGVRYHLPIGPLRIDAAYNPGERWAATESYAVEGAIGFTF